MAHQMQQQQMGAPMEHIERESIGVGDESEQEEQDFVRTLTKQNHMEHDLKKLHLTHRYDTKQLRAKVPWYRNSYETATPFTEICQQQEKPIEMDAPLVIPKELRPLGAKRRYLRTVQLATDPLLVAASVSKPLSVTPQNSANGRSVPFEDTLRKRDPARLKMPKANSHAVLPTAKSKLQTAAAVQKTRSGEGLDVSVCEKSVVDEEQQEEGDDGDGKAFPRHRARSGKLQSKPQLLNPLHTSASTHPADRSGPHRRLARQISLEEMEDLPNYKTYFGANAKRDFFAQYHNLYSRPYLFVESTELAASASSAPTSSTSSTQVPLDSTESNCVPVYPSSRELKRISQELTSYGAAVAAGTSSESAAAAGGGGLNSNELPMRDKLSPRSLFLTSCVTKPQLAVPFMLRKRMTKVFDFSFQSLGDAFIQEFAKCIVQDLPFVEEILVRDNRLSDDGLNALLEAVSEGSSMLNLLRLDISQNEMGAKSAHTLRAYIASTHCTLTTLLVDNADIDDRECAAFMTAFEKNLSIKHLRMSRNCIGKMEHLNVVQPDFTTGGEAIASMLHRNLVLVHLDLSWNYLRLESSITLAKSIHENHTLTEFNLSYNACGDAGAMAFGEALRFNECLEVLNLSYNSIGCKGAMVLANAIRVNKTLRSLQLNGNNIGREGGQLMLFALCENQTENGCDVGLHACNLGASVASMPHGPSTSYAHTAGSSVVSASNPEFNIANLPVYSSTSNRVFNPKEPTGRYILDLSEAYDKMIVMELVRLARVKKGCRFLRVEHWAGGAYVAPASAKKSIQLIRRERDSDHQQQQQHNQRLQPMHHNDQQEENSLETRGLDALFANIDKDKSGYVDQKEVMSVLNRIGLFPRMDNLSTVLETFDYNSSGYLEAGEFSAFLFHAVFQMIDVDKSGKIDADEMEEAFKMLGIMHYEPKEITSAIATYDISGDGEIEESEFVEFMKDSLLEKIKLQICLTSPSSSTAGSAKESSASGDGGLSDNSLVSLIDTATHKPWVVPEEGRLEIDFLYEREAFASNEEAHRQCKISQLGIEQLIRNITHQASSKSEQDELFHVAIHDSEIRFTASQAYQMLEACGYMKPPDEKKVEMIAMILPQMLTAKEAQILVSRTLTIKQRCRLKVELGSAYSVVLGNPTAHYTFDLAKPKDRIALNKIAEVAQSEKLFSKFKSGRSDTSQHGNWENFRNEELDGQKIVITSAFFLVLPRRGKLSFDYVSTARPKRGTTPMSAWRFEQLIKELKASLERGGSGGSGKKSSSAAAKDENGHHQPDEDSDDEDKERGDALADVQTAGGNRDKVKSIAVAVDPTANADATGIAAAFATLSKKKSKKQSVLTKQTQFWERTRASLFKRGGWQFIMTQTTSKFLLPDVTRENIGMKLVQIESAVCDRWLSCEQAAQIIACMPSAYHAQPETARILFSRLIDLDNFYHIYDSLSKEDQYICAKTLGWLNLCNPTKPEREYALDVSICDEREMTKLLVELAIAEPGENWINQSFSPARGEPGIPGWKLPVRWEKDDGKDGGVNRSGFLEMEYYSGQDRGCAPVPAFRKTLLTRTLCGTKQYCL